MTAPEWPGGYRRIRRRRRAIIAAASALVLLLVLTVGALLRQQHRRQWQADHAPTRTHARTGDPNIPAIDWPNGPPHDGPWTDNPWVDTLREYNIVSAAAYNTGDLTGSTDLHRLATDDLIDDNQTKVTLERTMTAESGSPDGSPFMPGPLTLTVLDVQETDEGAIVTTCRAGGIITGSADNTLSIMSSTSGRIIDWTLTLDDDGNRHLTYIDIRSKTCEVDDVHYGLFDPQPERVTPTP